MDDDATTNGPAAAADALDQQREAIIEDLLVRGVCTRAEAEAEARRLLPDTMGRSRDAPPA